MRIQPVRLKERLVAMSLNPPSLPTLWGDDAQEWNPERFLGKNAEKQVKVGMFANL